MMGGYSIKLMVGGLPGVHPPWQGALPGVPLAGGPHLRYPPSRGTHPKYTPLAGGPHPEYPLPPAGGPAWGTPQQGRPCLGYPPAGGPHPGYPPSPIRSSIACTCYAAVGMPLAFTQEDFLVKNIYICVTPN